MSRISPADVPQPLVDSILNGRCIAFVGAGFTQPAVPAWTNLLAELGKRLELPATLSDKPAALEYELMGQALRQHAQSATAFERCVKQILDDHHRDSSPHAVKGRRTVEGRCEQLRRIPFKAILTTNFDQWLPGGPTNAKTYREVLRGNQGRWWDFPLTSSDKDLQVPIIKLHGDANGDPENAPVVLGRTDYRDRLYSEHGYTNFIRAAFAEYTVLFLGVSFTDAYLNELRSETLHLLHEPDGQQESPWGYAVMKIDQASRHLVDLYRAHERIEVLAIPEFDQFDEWLGAIESRTSVKGRLTELLQDELIVWVDANPANNERGREFFETCGAKIVTLTSESELTDDHSKAALLVTQFGYTDRRAFGVLDIVRTWPLRPPVIVFADPRGPVADNRRECLRRGAWEYATQWNELYALIEALFARAPGTPRG